jgi:nuclear protein localization protein 4 homolog
VSRSPRSLSDLILKSSIASKPANTSGSRPLDNDGFEEIPPELLDEMAMDVDSGSPGGSRPRSRLGEDTGTAGGARSKKVCPHCTFENEAGATDCDVCGLPLG